jgi:clan AA aspartic protease (TIGR02281 family)
MDIMKCEFKIDKRRIIVSAQIKGINDVKELKFIIDTGASKTVIDEDAIRRLGFELYRLQSSDRLMTADGSIRSKILKLPTFCLFEKDLVNFEVNVIKLPPQITYFVDGLIGMDFLLQFGNLRFDFDKKVIEIDN